VDFETIKIIQGYAYWFLTIVLVIALYSYIIHMYRSEKRGEKDYEKYGRLALDDELTQAPIDPHQKNIKREESK